MVSKQPPDVHGFFEEYRFLSNFFPSTVWFEGLQYPTVEHAYQAAKNDDPVYRVVIQEAVRPGMAKSFGNKCRLRSDWDEVKSMIMLSLLGQKFLIPELREKLLDTGNAYLEETNSWNDIYWGVCNGKGRNVLGQQLMFIRESLRIKPCEP